MADVKTLSPDGLHTMEVRSQVVTKVAVVLTVACWLAGIWVDWRWFPTSLVFIVVCVFAACGTKIVAEETQRRLKDRGYDVDALDRYRCKDGSFIHDFKGQPSCPTCGFDGH